MSAFYESWEQCMDGNGFPVPNVETLNEAIEIFHKIHSAWENTGADEEITIGALLSLGALSGLDEGVLATLQLVAQVAVIVYVSAGITCISSVAYDELKELFANNDLPDFVANELNNQGIDLSGEATV